MKLDTLADTPALQLWAAKTAGIYATVAARADDDTILIEVGGTTAHSRQYIVDAPTEGAEISDIVIGRWVVFDGEQFDEFLTDEEFAAKGYAQQGP